MHARLRRFLQSPGHNCICKSVRSGQYCMADTLHLTSGLDTTTKFQFFLLTKRPYIKNNINFSNQFNRYRLLILFSTKITNLYNVFINYQLPLTKHAKLSQSREILHYYIDYTFINYFVGGPVFRGVPKIVANLLPLRARCKTVPR